MIRSVRLDGPRVTSLAAALSLAIASASLGAAGSNTTPKFQHTGPSSARHAQFAALIADQKTTKHHADLHRFQAAAQKELSSLPAVRPTSRAPRTVHISSRADSGSGSLRDALNNAVEGDVIDLSSMHGTLTLSSSLMPIAGVTINGPGRDALTIDAHHAGRALTSAHSLKLSNVTIANGATPHASSTAGGCLFINGDLSLNNVTLNNCTAGTTSDNYAYGGAVAVLGSLTMDSSTLSNNAVVAGIYGGGGAAVVVGSQTSSGTTLTNSTLTGNSVTAGIDVVGGALASAYTPKTNTGASLVSMSNTTVSGNTLTATSFPNYYNATTKQTYYYGVATGGGVWTAGCNVSLANSHIDNNSQTANNTSFGGGLYSKAEVYRYYNATTQTYYYYNIGGAASIESSTISGNSSTSVYRWTYGGGMQATGDITIDNSTISGNKLVSDCKSGCFSVGGGISGGRYTYNMSITGSTLSGNSVSATDTSAYTSGGGLATQYANFGTALTITNSTISGNSTDTANTGQSTFGAGVYQVYTQYAGSTTINNSTIAFNSSRDYGAGITTTGNLPLTLNSTIVSNNTSTTFPAVADIAAKASTFTVGGDYNLVQTDPGVYGTTFSGTHTILGSDPLLKPLANNGGPTQTHALDPTSPAIDTGSNPLSLTFDQRGSPYARSVGNAPDIGAFELDTDHIFGNGFE